MGPFFNGDCDQQPNQIPTRIARPTLSPTLSPPLSPKIIPARVRPTLSPTLSPNRIPIATATTVPYATRSALVPNQLGWSPSTRKTDSECSLIFPASHESQLMILSFGNTREVVPFRWNICST